MTTSRCLIPVAVFAVVALSGAGAAAAQSTPGAGDRCTGVATAPCQLLAEYQSADSASLENRDWAFSRHQRARQIIGSEPDSPVAWYVLGFSHLTAAKAGVIAREGPLQPPGISHESAAGRSFIRALEVDSTLVEAAIALALVPRPREGPKETAQWLPILRRYREVMPGPARFAVAKTERDAGNVAASNEWLDATEHAGAVSAGAVALEQARNLYALGRAAEGEQIYLSGAGDTSEAGRGAYRSELALTASPEELVEWDSLAAGDRPGWLRSYWYRRDVAQGWAAGSRLKEHYRRVEDAWARYRTAIPATGRHRVATVARHFDFYAEDLLKWQQAHEIPPSGGSSGDGTPVDGAAWASAMDLQRLESDRVVTGRGGMLRAFVGAVDGLDDRGIVLIRYGEPEKNATTVGGESLELWLYFQPDGPLLLSFREQDFDGQTGASVLTPTVAWADPRQRQQLCHLDTRLCFGDMDPSSQFLSMGGETAAGNQRRVDMDLSALRSGTLMARAREDGEKAIQQVTTGDQYRRSFSKAVQAGAGFYGMSRTDGRSVLVVPFAIPGDQIEGVPIDGGRYGYRVRLTLHAVRAGDGRVETLDTIRGFATPRKLAKGDFLTGLVEMAITPGESYTASLTAEQEGGVGAVVSIDRMRVPTPRRTGISDLVLGREGGGATWSSGTQAVAMNPLHSFKRGENVEVYFQVHGAEPGTPINVRYELWSAEREAREPRISFSMDERSDGLLHEVSRGLGLDRVDAGRYRLRVVTKFGGQELTSEAMLTVVR